MGMGDIIQALVAAAQQQRAPTGMEKSTFGIDYGVPGADPRSEWFKQGNRLNTMLLDGRPSLYGINKNLVPGLNLPADY